MKQVLNNVQTFLLVTKAKQTSGMIFMVFVSLFSTPGTTSAGWVLDTEINSKQPAFILKKYIWGQGIEM